jgi:hypothetical protein
LAPKTNAVPKKDATSSPTFGSTRRNSVRWRAARFVLDREAAMNLRPD